VERRHEVHGSGCGSVWYCCHFGGGVEGRVRVGLVGRGTLLGPEGTGGFSRVSSGGPAFRQTALVRCPLLGVSGGVGGGCGVGVCSLLENCIVDASIFVFCGR
jgi:hypothetical protein